MLNETSDMVFKAYLTVQQDPRMVLAQETRRACRDPAAPLTPGSGAGGAGAATPARPPKMQVSATRTGAEGGPQAED